MTTRGWQAFVVVAGLMGCGAGCGVPAAKDVGAQLFNDARLSTSDVNAFSCATCHAVDADDDRILPGASLVDAAHRSAYWGGAEVSMLDATNACLTFFMREAVPLSRSEPRSRALYEFLASISPNKDVPAVPFTIVENVSTVAKGDPRRGAEVWDAACASCHGEPHSGEGRITELASKVPEDSVGFAEQSGFSLDLVVVEKIRHGNFLGVGGTMPPFSTQSMSDEDLGALVAFLGL